MHNEYCICSFPNILFVYKTKLINTIFLLFAFMAICLYDNNNE